LIKVAHVITDLDTGGAEMMLLKLLSGLDRDKFSSEVVSLTNLGTVAEKLQETGITVRALSLRRSIPSPFAIPRLASWFRRSRPHIVQTWMYHADLIGGLAARLTGGVPVVWGIRQVNLDPAHTKRTTIWTAKTCAVLSRNLATCIVCCAEAVRRVHVDLGYAADKMVVIPNGFDLSVYKSDGEARRSVRGELGVSEETPLIGLFGRFDAQKDHQTFARSAGILHQHVPAARFLLCGDGITWDNRILVAWIEAAGVKECCYLLGRRDDIPRLTAALDIASSSSYGEGFANAVGEAMACGVPCVVTDVGDSAVVVGDTGKVVPSKNADALAGAWRSLIDLGAAGRAELGRRARLRIQDNYSLAAIVRRYENLYAELYENVWHRRAA
jgi:glycosyltransferase involved in cell wall biosynthesis